MSSTLVFQIHLVLGYLAWLLCFGTYLWPRLKQMGAAEAQRAIATFHGFRFFGLVFLLPGVVGPHLPTSFSTFAAYGDFATGVLALLALLSFRMPRLFWLLAAAFNVVGIVDLVMDYAHAIQAGVPEAPGQLGAAYAIPIVYVPLLMITHMASVGLAWRSIGRRRSATLQAS
jgi:hypothetical protein